MRVWSEAESAAPICSLAAVPTAPAWLPGLVTVTVVGEELLLNAAMPFGVPQPVGPL